MMKLITANEDRLCIKIKEIGVDPYAFYLINKGLVINLSVSGVTPCQANIIKQESLAVGVDAAVARGVVDCSKPISDLCLLAHRHGLKKLIEKLKRQPFGLKELAVEMEQLLEKYKPSVFLGDEILSLDKPQFMAILNVTPDSFSDGGKYLNREDIVRRLNEIRSKGVCLVDIGGESTRPFSSRIDALEEWDRIKFAIEYALKIGLKVSVDTYKSEVAAKALDIGTHIINDVSGLSFDEKLPSVISKYDATLCIMHMKGTPENMQIKPTYKDVVDEVYSFLYKSIEKAIDNGINENRIIVDPGFGFGKTLEHNIHLLKYLSEFQSLRKPIMVGISKKSIVGELTGKPIENRTLGSKILETVALLNGANIIRSHDINESKELVAIMSKILDNYDRVI